jgi:hypothetical protein
MREPTSILALAPIDTPLPTITHCVWAYLGVASDGHLVADLRVGLHYGIASYPSFLSDGDVRKQHHVLVNERLGANSDTVA